MKRAFLFLLLLGVAAGPAPGTVDSFYRARMANGVRAFEQGNWEVAARQLRIACFGHLEEPPELVEGLVRLAIAEARLGDEDAFRRAFSRIIELEERFAAYGSARLPAALAQQFESLAAGLVPSQALRSAGTFAGLALRADLERLSALPPDRRRAELAARIEAEPGRPDLVTESAKLELELRRPAAALDWLDRLPADAADLPPAICLRQQAAAEVDDCGRMDLVRPFCQGVPAAVVEFRLQCLVEAGRWPEAAGLIEALDPEVRARRRVGRLERRVRDNFDGPAQPPATASIMPEPEPPAEPVAPPAAASVAADPPELDDLRRRLDAATSSDELAALLGDAESLADGHPGSRRARLLAAEIAYLMSDWSTAVAHFDRMDGLESDEAHLSFYRAVALYESGDRAAAAEILRPVAPRLQRNEFVDDYVRRILEPAI